MSAHFCRNCGQSISPDMRFCMHCGKDTGQQAGSTQQTQHTPVHQAQAVLPHQGDTAGQVMPSGRVRRKPTVSLLLIGIIILFFGLRLPLLTLFGAQATGLVTSVEQRINSHSSSMDYNFDVAYRFSTRDGQSVSGSFFMGRVLDRRKLPAVGSQLTIRYWPGLSFINVPAEGTSQGYASFILAALGVLLIVMGLRGVPVSFRRTFR